jgi:hypothetical protein
MHQTVNHVHGEYVRGIVHTNTIEGFFGISSAASLAFISMSVAASRALHDQCDFRYNHRIKPDTTCDAHRRAA